MCVCVCDSQSIFRLTTDILHPPIPNENLTQNRFYSPYTLPVTQSTVSKHSLEMRMVYMNAHVFLL